jgi:hypothetical protein
VQPAEDAPDMRMQTSCGAAGHQSAKPDLYDSLITEEGNSIMDHLKMSSNCSVRSSMLTVLRNTLMQDPQGI